MGSSGVRQAAPWSLPARQATDRRIFPQAGNLNGSSTSAGLGVGTLRLAPGYIPSPLTVSQLGGDITLVGDVGSTLVLTVYGDAGMADFPYPGSLVSSGVILGDSATPQEVDVADFTLGIGWYWFGGVVQNVTVTQPTVRTLSGLGLPGIPLAIAPTSNATFLGYTFAGVVGVIPTTLAAYSGNIAGSIPRVHLRLA